MPASVWIINLVVLTVVLEADLGHRKITWARLARPVVVAGAIIVFSLRRTPPATGGGGLAFELALAALGVLLGLGAGLIFGVYRDREGVPRSRAGVGYAVGWAVVIGARIGFAYATGHSRGLQVWLGTHQISTAALTDALIFMAAGLLLARTLTLLSRARRLPGAPEPHRAGQHESVASPAGSRQP